MIVIALVFAISCGNVYANGLLNGVVIDNQVNLTESTSKGSPINTVLSKGASINILDVYGAYLLVSREDQWGWVHKNYVFVHDGNYNLVSFGKIKASKLNVRQGPNMDQPVVGSLLNGDDVIILKASDDKDWYYVKNDIIEGWISAVYATETYQNKKAIMSAVEKSIEISRGDERTETDHAALNIGADEEVELLDYQNGWYYIKKSDGTLVWLSEDDINVNLLAPKDNGNEDVVKEAKKHLGKPYKWGATGPSSFDCSGYTRYVYRQVGIELPRVSRDQAKVGEPIHRDDLQIGDLVFFDTSGAMNNIISHLGIYIGDNQFIHASSGKTGRYVRISSLNKDFYKNRYVTARRVK